MIFSKYCFERIGSLKRCSQILILFLSWEALQQLFARRVSAEYTVSHCWWSQGWLMAYCTVSRWSTSAHMRPSIISWAWWLRAWYASLPRSNWALLIDSFRSYILIHRENIWKLNIICDVYKALTAYCPGRDSARGACNRCSIRRTKDRCSRCTSARALKPPAPDRYACRLAEWTFASCWPRYFYLLNQYDAVWIALIYYLWLTSSRSRGRDSKTNPWSSFSKRLTLCRFHLIDSWRPDRPHCSPPGPRSLKVGWPPAKFYFLACQQVDSGELGAVWMDSRRVRTVSNDWSQLSLVDIRRSCPWRLIKTGNRPVTPPCQICWRFDLGSWPNWNFLRRGLEGEWRSRAAEGSAGRCCSDWGLGERCPMSASFEVHSKVASREA